jgi:hypothetical protein
MRSAPRRLTRRMVEPTVVTSRLGWTRRNFASSLSVRDRLAPERPPRGWRLLRLLPRGCDGIPSGSDSYARPPRCPCCRLRRRSTGIHCWRRRPIGSLDADGRRRQAACELQRRGRGHDSRLPPGLGRHHALLRPRDGLPRGLAAGRRPPGHQGRDLVAARRALPPAVRPALRAGASGRSGRRFGHRLQ